jgi:hypothetical protein
MLMQLELNGKANKARYAKLVREELLGNSGFGAPRYVIDKTGSSLRTFTASV